MTQRTHIGDSARGQGCAAPGFARLVLEAVKNRHHPRTGALRTQCALKHLSAEGNTPTTLPTRTFCENGAMRTQNVVARQRVNEVNP